MKNGDRDIMDFREVWDDRGGRANDALAHERCHGSYPWTDNEYVGARLRTIVSPGPVSKERKRLRLDGIFISFVVDGAVGGIQG